MQMPRLGNAISPPAANRAGRGVAALYVPGCGLRALHPARGAGFSATASRRRLPGRLPVLTRASGSRPIHTAAGPELARSAAQKHDPAGILTPTCLTMDQFLADELWTALEERQNELITRLDELNAQIEAALAELERAAPAPPQQQAA